MRPKAKYLLMACTTLVAAMGIGTAWAVSGAGFTTFDSTALGCLGSQNGVNCNNYTAKDKVYMSGGPTAAGLGDGCYYFSVLTPGSQNGGFTDGASGNLSDLPGGDLATNRTFHVSDHKIDEYAVSTTCGTTGTHGTGTSPNGRAIIQLAPYDDTLNPGGVYILAICVVGADSPSQCKYDAFRVPSQVCTDNCTPPALPLTVSKDADASFDRMYHWKITKTVNQSQINAATGTNEFTYTVTVDKNGEPTDSNWKVDGTITIQNPNPETAARDNDASGVVVTDQIDYGASQNLSQDPKASCNVDTSGGADPAEGMSVDLPYSCTYSGAPTATPETNHVNITWVLPGSSADTADFFLQGIDFDSPNVVDGCVTVTDTLGGSLGTVCQAGNNIDALPKEFIYTVKFTGDPAGTCTSHNNTATIDGTYLSASRKVTVCVGADLNTSKTAYSKFDSSIIKTSKQTSPVASSGPITLNYTVKVTESNWTVYGTITVGNPNDWEDVTVNLADALSVSGNCTVSGGSTQTVPKSGSISPTYSCTFASAPPASGTNKATATWNSGAYSTPGGSAEGSAGYTFSSLTVIDTFNGGTAKTLGTISVPTATTTYNDSYTVTPSRDTCVVYPNTAKIKETSQWSGQSVTACNTATGALTIGFWQNKNGQGIIGASTSGVCSSATWLRQFAPFQDLSATATCAQVGTYVTTIIKSANASGAAMNAMLKAQMLATSLDVYFSNPALGGNKINALTPIGAQKIDLTQVCAMIDNPTTGTATCSGTYQNSSSAFGGATSPTVAQMLAYAASQSNPGGSTWYGQVKATQQLAKNAFDAVNNQVAIIVP